MNVSDRDSEREGTISRNRAAREAEADERRKKSKAPKADMSTRGRLSTAPFCHLARRSHSESILKAVCASSGNTNTKNNYTTPI